MSRHLPYGYRIENGVCVINNEESGILKKLFLSYLEVGTLLGASDKSGFNTKSHACVKRILINKRYLGDDYYPKIIEKELFEKVNEKLKEKENSRKGVPSDEKTYQDIIGFKIRKEEKKILDPFELASYRYSLIECEVKDGK
ncbi:hypothetical protein HMPREF9709_01845 [Helcococcus kunzii ATCC 51366]|uniref:Recombinase domain-containing protein n=1 Tax=Helcococcus kunzii ATCC 51366 TaxID=883114 RepID=H3NR84_9FIRM|nr:hypothetical protein [Helcococcus kunzii]EHR31678.1 hypothetical protein HMPREF9709_01845 [Helcococcus kunzii ATCC 51366]